MSAPQSRSQSPGGGDPPKPPKFMNGWTKEQENLMAGWADIASCYRWMHDKCEKRYSGYNMSLSIPVIILSTLTGTANFAIDSFVPPGDDSLKKYVQAGIGGISIFAGILTTLGNFLRFAQLSEAHRVASISWGKLQRQIAVELRIHPNDRLDCLDFLKISRAELDRLIEQSPAIPDPVIKEFENEFKDLPSLVRPDIAHGMDHTIVFHDKDTMLKKLTADAAILLKAKKKMLRDEIVPDLDRRIVNALEPRLNAMVAQRMAAAEAALDKKVEVAREEAKAAAAGVAAVAIESVKKEEEAIHNTTRIRIRAPIPSRRGSFSGVVLPTIVPPVPVVPAHPLTPKTDQIGDMMASAFRVVQPAANSNFEISFSTPSPPLVSPPIASPPLTQPPLTIQVPSVSDEVAVPIAEPEASKEESAATDTKIEGDGAV